MKDLVEIPDVLLFHGGVKGTELYTLEYLQDCEQGTREVAAKGVVTHITPRHPWDKDATDDDIDAWLAGESRGDVKNMRANLMPVSALGLDPATLLPELVYDFEGEPAVPAWFGDCRFDEGMLAEIKDGRRSDFSAGFRDHALKLGIDKPYCDHFAAFGHGRAHCPALSAQRFDFEERAGRSRCDWFSEKHGGLVMDIPSRRTRRDDFEDAKPAAGASPADVQAIIQQWTATEVMEFAKWFRQFQDGLQGFGTMMFSEAELQQLPPKFRDAVKTVDAERREKAKGEGEAIAARRKTAGNTFAELLITGVPAVVSIPALHQPLRDLCQSVADAHGRDDFAEATALPAKQVRALVEAIPVLEGKQVIPVKAGGTPATGRDEFDEAAELKSYEADAKALGYTVTDVSKRIHLKNARAKKLAAQKVSS